MTVRFFSSNEHTVLEALTMLFLGELQFVSRRRVGVHERRGPLGACAVAGRLAARRGAAFVRPFSFVTFILGKQKKSKMYENAH